jgi:CBS domain-containing protein
MLKVVDVMTKDVATICASATVAEAVELMNARGWRSLIVERQDPQDSYGIISETDIAYKIIAKSKYPPAEPEALAYGSRSKRLSPSLLFYSCHSLSCSMR